jgi:PhnB protein
MASVSTYFNFPGTAEEAFNFYRSVFGGEFAGPIYRFAEMPLEPGKPPLSEADQQLVMHVALPILGGHLIMGTDATEGMGFKWAGGNHTYVSLNPDTRAEADRLFAGLSAGGTVETPMQDMFWGAYFGSFTDRFGVNWMINCEKPAT